LYYRDKKVVGVFCAFLLPPTTVDIVIANSLAVVQITKNLVKEERPDGSNNLSFHQVIQPLPSLMPPYYFKNTKILTCGMPVVGLYLQPPYPHCQ
jgi:hypothetical protein